jgi:phospholipase C
LPADPLISRAAAACPAGTGLSSVEHVVILIQENRSFDHYLGTLAGVRGFDDHPPGSPGVFAQAWPSAPAGTKGRLLPFRFDTVNGNGACTNDVTHEWGPQHQCWDGGRMSRWVSTHVAADGPDYGTATMGYYTRADLPFYHALADAFTVCDHYHSSVMGPTYPNRLYSMTATIDPDGRAGGPVVTNPTPGPRDVTGIYSWTTMPERLEAQGVSWKIYNQVGTNNNVLALFSKFTNPSSALFRRALLPTFPGEFQADAAAGTLPQVAWVLAPMNLDEHPPAPPAIGEWVTSQVLSALVANPAVWAKTVLFVTHDENGGFFDHVAPPVPPPGTAGEYLTVRPLPAEAAGVSGPVGLGFRVPALVVSPFSRGGLVCSDTFDHTSLLRFLETRFGVEVPNLSPWRRSVTGDLTSAMNLAAADPSMPALPAVAPVTPAVVTECGPTAAQGQLGQTVGGSFNVAPYPPPANQSMPVQEPGTRRRVSAATGCGPAAGRSAVSGTSGRGETVANRSAGELPATGPSALPLGTSAVALLLGWVAARALRRRASGP